MTPFVIVVTIILSNGAGMRAVAMPGETPFYKSQGECLRAKARIVGTLPQNVKDPTCTAIDRARLEGLLK